MDKVNIFFSPDITDRERACFETGIKLGALYHIICGIPISNDEKTISSIEKGIEAEDIKSYCEGLNFTPPVQHFMLKINREEQGKALSLKFIKSHSLVECNIFVIKKGQKEPGTS